MSMKLDAGPISRQDVFGILPQNIIVDHKENGRAKPHTPEEIEALARSIYEQGQLQAVVCRRIDGNRVQLVAGYGRVAAVAWINAHLNPTEPVKVRCSIVECSPEEAYIRNLVENIERAETTPIDDAHNQRRLREVFGWEDERIATFYKRSVSYIHQLRKLPTLERPLQDAVANGDLAVSTAVELANVPAAKRAEIVKDATDGKGKVKTAKVRQKVREHQEETGQGKPKHRTAKEVKEFLDSMTGLDEDAPVRELAETFLRHFRGEVSDAEMSSWMVDFCKPLVKKGKR